MTVTSSNRRRRKPSPHPRKPYLEAWLFTALALTAALVLMVPYGLLPLYGATRDVEGFGSLFLIPIALVAGAAFALPLALWWVNLQRAAWILRPTPIKILASFLILLVLPTAIAENGQPMMPIPIYLLVGFTSGSALAMLRTLLTVLLGMAIVYPFVTAIIWGMPRGIRVLGLLGLPIGLYCFVMIAGGHI